MWDLLSSGPSSPPPAPPPPQQLLPQRVFTEAVLPFVERAGKQNFSLIEVGSWNGVHSLELAARYARSTLLVLEPNRSVWEQHTALAIQKQRRPTVVHNSEHTALQGVFLGPFRSEPCEPLCEANHRRSQKAAVVAQHVFRQAEEPVDTACVCLHTHCGRCRCRWAALASAEATRHTSRRGGASHG